MATCALYDFILSNNFCVSVVNCNIFVYFVCTCLSLLTQHTHNLAMFIHMQIYAHLRILAHTHACRHMHVLHTHNITRNK